MAEFHTETVSAQAKIAPGDVQTIHFRPGQPGSVGVLATIRKHATHSETGLLAQARLFRAGSDPGSDEPVATSMAHMSDDLVGLGYNATAADLAVAGDWTCEISNESDNEVTFNTTVEYVSNIPLQTASFDIGLLNLLLSEAAAAAALRVHLQSGPPGDDLLSQVSWSPAVAGRLGQTGWAFPLQDPPKHFHFTIPLADHDVDVDVVFRLTNFDSGPAFPTVAMGNSGLSIMIRFDTSVAKLVALDWPVPDVDLGFFELQINIMFDGSVQVVCTTRAEMTFVGFRKDVSDDLKDAFEKEINNRISNVPQLAPAQVRQYLEEFFAGLMQLSHQDALGVNPAHIERYQADGQQLIVSYYIVPRKVHHVGEFLDGGVVTHVDGGG